MHSELAIYAARLREYISICSEESDTSPTFTSPTELHHAEAEFNGLAMVLFALQYRQNSAYRQCCEARGVIPDAICHWSEIPAAPAAAFKELEFTCLQRMERTHAFHSSGTTGQRPSRHFHCADSLAVYEASLWAWFCRHLCPSKSASRLLVLTPPPAQVPHSSLVHMFEIIRRNLGAEPDVYVGRIMPDGSWLVDFGAATWAMECSRRDRKPMLVLGTAFSFVHLLDALELAKLPVQLPPGSRVMETGGYKGRSRSLAKAELHALINKCLGVPSSHIVCEYGMSELSSQAYDDCERRVFNFPPWARVQVVSPETGAEVAEGETGLLRIFDLANVYSVMAVQTEDLAIRRGNGFELVGRLEHSEPRGCSLMAS